MSSNFQTEPKSETADIHKSEDREAALDGEEVIEDNDFVSKNQPEEAMGESDEIEDSRCYERLSRRRCCGPAVRRCPRTCAVIIGVLFPLTVLIMLSLAFGGILCEEEAPPEFSANDQKLADRWFANQTSSALLNLTLVMPKVCWVLYIREQNATVPLEQFSNASELVDEFSDWIDDLDRLPSVPDNPLLIPFSEDQYVADYPDEFVPETWVVNATELFQFMGQCGNSINELSTRLLTESVSRVVTASDQLTFNWIRCFEGAHSGERNFGGGGLTAQQRSQSGQSSVYLAAWEKDREQLFDTYFNETVASGMDPIQARRTANVNATNDATGRDVCELNAPAAAWFWFTVQTTIGYGNTPPTTSESRTMVYTIGFLSILAFGGILAAAGGIMSFLLDRYAERWGMKFLTVPWVGAIIWGTAYYTWMLVISWATIRWKQKRLDLPFDWNDGYWFAYISTTTVGLGDLVLEPNGIIGADLFTFPVIFLAGLTCFAAFIGKFAEFILDLVRRGRKSLVDTLLEREVAWGSAFAKDRLSQSPEPGKDKLSDSR